MKSNSGEYARVFMLGRGVGANLIVHGKLLVEPVTLDTLSF